MSAIQPRHPAEMHVLRPRAEGGFAREVQVDTDGPRGLVRDREGALWTTAGKGAYLRRLPADGAPAEEYAADDRTHIAEFLLDPATGRPWVRTAFEIATLGEGLAEEGRFSFGGFGFQRRMAPDGDGLAVLDEQRLVRLAPDAAVREEQDLGFRAGHLVAAGDGTFLASDGYPGHLARAGREGVTRLSDSAFEKSVSTHGGSITWVDGQEPRGTPRTLAILDPGSPEADRLPGEAGARSSVALPGGRTLLYREFVLAPSLSILDRDGQELARHELGDAALVKDFLVTPDRSRAWAVAQRRESSGPRMVQALLEFDLAGAGPMRIVHESPDDFMPAPLRDGGVLLFAKDGVTRLDGDGKVLGSWAGPAEMLRSGGPLPEVAAEQATLGALAFDDARADLGDVLAEAQRRYRYAEEGRLPLGPGREIGTTSGLLRTFDAVGADALAPLTGLADAAGALRMTLLPGLAEAVALSSRIPLAGDLALELSERELLLRRPGEELQTPPGIRLSEDRFTAALPFTADDRSLVVAATARGRIYLWDPARREGGVETFDAGSKVRSLRLTERGVAFATDEGALGVVRLPGRAIHVPADREAGRRKEIVEGSRRVRVGDVELPLADA